MIQNTNITIGIGVTEEKLKLAAIFFDQILPVITEYNVPKNLICQIPINSKKISLAHEKNLEYHAEDVKTLMSSISPSFFEGRTEIKKDEILAFIKLSQEEAFNSIMNLEILETAKQLNSRSTLGVPIFNESILLNRIMKDNDLQIANKRIEIELINAPIIDTKTLKWEQISDAKKDPEFNIKAKRFGLFINKNYQNKDLNYIVDDLTIQLEDYKNACRKHGIELINGSLKSLADSRSLFGTLGLVVCSIISKAPDAALLSGAIGGTLEVLKMGVTVREYNDKFNFFIKESPIALIYEIEKMKKSN